MPEEKEVLGVVRFGRFQLSADTGELCKDGIRLKLSGQAIQVLTILAASPGKLVTREELQQKLWPGASYGDPEHGLNAAVNKLRETLGDSATEPKYIETVPGRGYRFVATTGGTVSPVEADHPWRRIPQLWMLIAAAILALALGIVGYRWYRARSDATRVAAGKPSLAVLPLKDLGSGPDSEYFADGLTDEITTKLSKIQGINVASRSAVTSLTISPSNVAEAARQLGVRYILEGSVRKSGDQVRINVHLVDSSSGFDIWAEDFKGEPKDVFSLQEQTALKIAQALNLQLSPQERKAVQQRYTQNPKAYEAFLVGRALLGMGTKEKYEPARKSFEQALKLDPNYAPALAGLSHVEGVYYRDVDSDPSRLQRAEQLALRALAIDPAIPDGHIALARAYGLRYEYVRAADEFREATRREPQNFFAWDLLSWALGYEQPPEALEAEKAAREAIRLQPSFPAAQYHLGRALVLQGRYQEAVAAFQRTEQLGSASYAYFGMAAVSLAQGNYDEAIAYDFKAGDTGTAISLYSQSAAYAAKGDNEKALATLQKAFSAGFRDFAVIDASPYFSRLGSDPRFQQLLQRYR
jgi:TolB-like protein/DNA-binding winged helix-turn-helix (wHTH) protein